MLAGRSNGDRSTIVVEVSGVIRPDLLEVVFDAIREQTFQPIEAETLRDAQGPGPNIAASLTVSEIIEPNLAVELAIAVAERIAGWRRERNMSPRDSPGEV